MATITTTPSRARLQLRMLGNEILKGLQVTWHHRATLLPQAAFVTLVYWTMQYFIGGGRFVAELSSQTLLGYLAFAVTYVALVRTAGGLLEEMFTGTFMQSLLSPLRPTVLIIGRLLGVLVEGILSAVLVAVLFIPLLGLDIPFRWEVLIPAILALMEAAGFALFIGGLALIVNSIGAIIHVLWSLLMMINGSFIPVDAFPLWLGVIAKLWPTTLAVDAAQRLLFDGASLASLWSDYTLQLAFGHAVLMVLLGWGVFRVAVRRGLKVGRLGP
jgi:ABC-2 type transport system permease protein